MSVVRFAQLDSNNRVLQVISIDDSNGMDENNNFSESVAVNWINNNLYQGQNLTWKQTWEDGSQRGRFADRNYTYDATNDWFQAPKPHASWTLDSNGEWQAPVAYPTITTYDLNGATSYYEIEWDEDNSRWNGTKRDIVDGANVASSHIWNATDLTWEAV